MATPISQVILPEYVTLPQFYENVAVGHIITENDGSVHTAPMALREPPDERRIPQHIIQDTQMCQSITQAARNYLNNSTAPAANLGSAHAVAEMLLHTRTGDETTNVDVFTHAAGYVRAFVQIADNLEATNTRAVPCANERGVRPNRKFQRDGIDRIIIEHMSVGAFNEHISGIQKLAQGNNGQGTEIRASSYEVGDRSMVFKLAKHMIDRNCSWGLLIGGNNFVVFYLDRLTDQEDTYYHIVLSDIHPAYSPAAPQGSPSLILVLIALLLGNPPLVDYKSSQKRKDRNWQQIFDTNPIRQTPIEIRQLQSRKQRCYGERWRGRQGKSVRVENLRWIWEHHGPSSSNTACPPFDFLIRMRRR